MRFEQAVRRIADLEVENSRLKEKLFNARELSKAHTREAGRLYNQWIHRRDESARLLKEVKYLKNPFKKAGGVGFTLRGGFGLAARRTACNGAAHSMGLCLGLNCIQIIHY